MNLKRFEKSGSIIDRDTVSIKMYLHDINKFPLLSAEEQLELLKEIRGGGKSGEEARQKLVECNLRIVVMVAAQYQQKRLQLCDLISEGNIGLIEAIDKYDENVGCRFVNYAVYWIRRAIIRAIVDKEEPVFVPWTQKELKEYFDVSSIDITLDEASDIPVSDTIVSEAKTDGKLLQDARVKNLKNILGHVLSTKEYNLVLKLFGIGCPEQTRAEIAYTQHVDESKVEAVYVNAIRKLRRSGITPDMLLR